MYHILSPSNKSTWSRQIINNVLSNENYLGNTHYPQIIDKEFWNAVQSRKILNRYSMRYSKTKTAV